MNYLGIDVHSKTTVWHLLDTTGETVKRGKVPTTGPALRELLAELTADGEFIVGQEVGTMTYFVHDLVTAAGIKILSFNAQHLRMIAASRKKTDRRDAYWIAKALQAGMTPHPVYIPTGEIRLLRSLLAQRQSIVRDRKRWLVRAKSHLRACGRDATSSRIIPRLIERATEHPDGLEPHVLESLKMCERMALSASLELKRIEATLAKTVKENDAIARLRTIPGVGPLTAATIYAWIGEVDRFPNARMLASYAGLVPSVSQSGGSIRMGGITKQGSGLLRSTLVQAAHVMMFRCRTPEAEPLQAIASRVHKSRARRKIAVVAAARHILRIAYYILRDGTVYDPSKVRKMDAAEETSAA